MFDSIKVRQASYRQHMLDHLKRIIQMDTISCQSNDDFEFMISAMLTEWFAYEVNHYPKSLRSALKVVNEQAAIRDLEEEADKILARIDEKALLLRSISERMQISLQLLTDNFSTILNGDTHEK